MHFCIDVLLLNFCSCFWLTLLMTGISVRGCAQINGEHSIGMYLIGFCCMLLQFWRYCTAWHFCMSLFSTELLLTCPHGQSWGIASVENGGRETHRG